MVAAAQERLKLLHHVLPGFTVGKNKLVFEMDNHKVIVFHDSDKVLKTRKTIVEVEDSFCSPIILNQDEKERFVESDIEKLVCGLDSYFLDEVLGMPKMAFCNRFYFAKDVFPALLGITEEDFLYYLAYEAGDSESMNADLAGNDLIIFLKGCSEAGLSKIFMFILSDYELKVTVFDGDLTELPPKNHDGKEPALETIVYSDHADDLLNAVNSIIGGYGTFDGFSLMHGKIQPYAADKDNNCPLGLTTD